MTPIPALGALDPRLPIPAREQLFDILGGLIPPPNYKVVLDVDKTTEKLVLKVLKREAYVVKFMAATIWRYTQSWTKPECEQRRIEGRTYDSLMEQLRNQPEFLEFEFVAEGALVYRVAAGA